MDQNKKAIPAGRQGFTLIEILTVLAIVGILSAVVLVSMSNYGPKARSVKVQSMAAGAITALVSCWGNTDNSGNLANVNSPVNPGGNNICSLGASYGTWPTFSGDLDNYDYGDLYFNNSVGYRSARWSFSLSSSADNKKICCNSTMNGCEMLNGSGATCDYNTPPN